MDLVARNLGKVLFQVFVVAATTRFRNRTRWWLSHTKFWLDNGSEDMIHYLNLLEEDLWRGDVVTGFRYDNLEVNGMRSFKHAKYTSSKRI